MYFFDSMEYTTLLAQATLFATALMLIGIVYASRQAFAAIEQLNHSKDSQAIGIHCGFQKEFRDLQQQFPANINAKNWVPENSSEERLLALYWEFVFDEWYSCNVIAIEPKVRRLWEGYSIGVVGALKRSAFLNAINMTMESDISYLGKAKEFRAEIERLKAIARRETERQT